MSLQDENPTLSQVVEPENDLKNMLVEYVGEKTNPKDGLVTVELIVDIMSKEFPEFVLAMAEENWLRGYQQALIDADSAVRAHEKAENTAEVFSSADSSDVEAC
tara:strand:- start:3708 stop:4019 length:312 start_codon:yes stop_codon:yes gene_type:complete